MLGLVFCVPLKLRPSIEVASPKPGTPNDEAGNPKFGVLKTLNASPRN
ncbi:MAG: hypothetical protein HC846_02520 [Blastocatellia bacterium]|nr:hypothetical protein [Blastocatellia bacterium]